MIDIVVDREVRIIKVYDFTERVAGYGKPIGRISFERLAEVVKKIIIYEGEIGKFFGYSIIEDNTVKEIRLPTKVIDFFKRVEVKDNGKKNRV